MWALKQIAGTVLLAAVLLAATPPAAPAASFHPKGDYAPFKECPLKVPTLTDCIYSVSDKGGFTVGKHKISLYSPLVLQGGFEGASEEITFHGAANGETIAPVPQPIPGVLESEPALPWWPTFLKEWFEVGVQKEAHSGVSAYIELAAPASKIKLDTEELLFEEGIALGLPLKIRLENQLLGSYCHVGSDAEPMQVNYSSGKSGKLSGHAGQLTFNKTNSMTTMHGVRIVDATFPAPGAGGCGGLLSGLVDPLVNEIFSLPAKPGQSTAVLEGTQKDGQVEAVRESEG